MKLRIDDKWRWLAMDETGDWCFYEFKPTIRYNKWFPCCNDRFIFSCMTPPQVTSWKGSLHRRVGDEWVLHNELNLKVDDPVMVRYENGEWFPRHFSHFDDEGLIRCFNEGTTSFTRDGTDYWTEWKLPEEAYESL